MQLSKIHKLSLSPDTIDVAQYISDACVGCGKCAKNCEFLQQNGTLGELSKQLLTGGATFTPYDCSLCSLCSEICPEQLDGKSLLLETRRSFYSGGAIDQQKYKTLLRYEKRGISPLFSFYRVPENTETVFFPGCNLPGTRPDQTLWLVDKLAMKYPNLGLVLNCCMKPSHDLGRQNRFHDHFSMLIHRLKEDGVKEVLVACPSCQVIFEQYGEGLTVTSAYGVISIPRKSDTGEKVFVHDACVTRKHGYLHDMIRHLAEITGFEVVKSKYSRRRTVCCGEGGGVLCSNPELSLQWGKKRKQESTVAPLPYLTYCGGCSEFLAKWFKTVHVLDLLIDAEEGITCSKKVYRSPVTYFNRLRFKYRLAKGSEDEKKNPATMADLLRVVPAFSAIVGLLVVLGVAWRIFY